MRIFFLLFITLLSFKTENDSAIKVEYNEVMIQNPQMVVKRTGKLYVSKSYTFYKSEFDKIENNNNNDDPLIINVNSKNNYFSEIIIDIKKKELTERLFEEIYLKKKYSVLETKPTMKWVLGNGQKKINNYDCSMAYTTFRGRTYIVWYTKEIPVSFGPWKFNGLPGLILLAEDKEGVYKWDVKTIAYPYKGKDIDFKKIIKDDPKFKKVSYKEFDKLKINAIKDKVEMIKARNKSRSGMKIGVEFSTHLEKEPINEWRSQTSFK